MKELNRFKRKFMCARIQTLKIKRKLISLEKFNYVKEFFNKLLNLDTTNLGI